MLIATIYGRLGKDPAERQTKTGKPMATASVVVDVTGKDAEPQSLWVGVLAFAATAEALLQGRQGDMLTAMGRLSRGAYTARDGTERENWTLIADSILSPRTLRAGGDRRPTPDNGERGRSQTSRKVQATDFNDPIPF